MRSTSNESADGPGAVAARAVATVAPMLALSAASRAAMRLLDNWPVIWWRWDDHRRGLQGDDFERLGHLMQRLGWIAFDPRERNFELAAQLCDIALGLYA